VAGYADVRELLIREPAEFMDGSLEGVPTDETVPEPVKHDGLLLTFSIEKPAASGAVSGQV
jgi:hypothetical protein